MQAMRKSTPVSRNTQELHGLPGLVSCLDRAMFPLVAESPECWTGANEWTTLFKDVRKSTKWSTLEI